jgi:hypothetical protein
MPRSSRILGSLDEDWGSWSSTKANESIIIVESSNALDTVVLYEGCCG